MNDDARPAPPEEVAPSGAPAGLATIRASVGGTVVFTLLAVAAVLADALVPPYVIVSLLMFLGGSLACVVAFLRAVDRSRTETIGVGGLFFGAGSTPRRVQVALLGSLAVEVVVAITAASLRLYTAVAFGTLAPMWALGLAGLWVARHGTFPSHEPELTRAGRRQADRAAHRRAGRPTGDGRTGRSAQEADGGAAAETPGGAEGPTAGSGPGRAPE